MTNNLNVYIIRFFVTTNRKYEKENRTKTHNRGLLKIDSER
jgi:hypothetical protein